MMMKLFHRIGCIGILVCTMLQSGIGQETLLNSMVYGSDKDSILLVDYVNGEYNHLILFQTEDCVDCSAYYSQYRQVSDQWSEQFNLVITIIAPRISNQASIESQVESYELESGLNVLVSDASQASSQKELIVTSKMRDVVSFQSYLEVDDIEKELQSLLEPTPNQFILDKHVLQCLEDLEVCSDKTKLLYTSGEVKVNDRIYTEVLVSNQKYALRESHDGRQVYLYHSDDLQEYLLLDYSGRQCDTITLYSVMTETMQSHRVSEYTCVNGIESWVLELPFDCDQELRTLTLTYGQGTNAGLIPLYDEAAVYTALLCQYEDTVLTMGDTEDCPIDKASQLSQLLIYPNPTQGNLIIDSGIQPIQLKGIYSIDGKLIFTLSGSSDEIDLTDLPQGIYLLAIEQNLRTIYHKIVKY